MNLLELFDFLHYSGIIFIEGKEYRITQSDTLKEWHFCINASNLEISEEK